MKNNNFIDTFYIDKKVCKNLLNYFNENKHLTKEGGSYGKIKTKKSTDLHIDPSSTEFEVVDYLKELNKCLEKYKKKYPVLNSDLSYWGITEMFNIQKYKKNEGFPCWHIEHSNENLLPSKRMLVFMTYLNDVNTDGETEWKYQKLKVKPKIGLTVLWPPYWTHLHRGIISKKEEKIIVTGWYSFI
jgi:hypothetical protein